MPEPEVVAFPNGSFVENTYVIADPDTRDCVMVDPGEEAYDLVADIVDRKWSLRAIWLTHAHIDHIAGVSRVRAGSWAPVHLHPADRPLYDNAPAQGAMFGLRIAPLVAPDEEFAEGQTLTVGGCRFDVIHTPGHTPGSVTFVGHGLAIAGDVLFAGSIGRTDLPGGDAPALIASIHTKLFRLPDDTVVLPGHGPQTTIGAEKATNPFVKLVPGVNACLRCGAEVRARPWGCRNPCANCGFVYPLGDCSD